MTFLAKAAAIGVIVCAFAMGAFTPSVSFAPNQAGFDARLSHPGQSIITALNQLDPISVKEAPNKPLPDWVTREVSAARPAPKSKAEPDIGAAFRSDLRAIVYEAGEARAWLKGATDMSPRKLASGDAYKDGWRIHEIHSADVVLARHGLQRRVSIYAPQNPPKRNGTASAMAGSKPLAATSAIEAPREWRRGDPRTMATPRDRRPH